MQTRKKKAYAAARQPEQEIVTIAHTVSAYLEKYRKPFTIAAAAAAVILVVAVAFSLLRSQQEQKASPMLAAALEQYRPAGGARDPRKALDLFRDVQKQYPNTKSGEIAGYYAGICLTELGQPEEAVKEFEAFKNKYSGDKFLLGLASQRLAYVYAGLGRSDDARKSFEQAEALLGPGVATMELARRYEAEGNQPEAQKKYKEVMDKLGGTTWAMEAMGKVQKIEPVPAPKAASDSK